MDFNVNVQDVGIVVDVEVQGSGPQGIPGKTPVRGEDYWTEDDKSQVVEEATELVGPLIQEAKEAADSSERYSLSSKEYMDAAEEAKNDVLGAVEEAEGIKESVTQTKTEIDSVANSVNSTAAEVDVVAQKAKQSANSAAESKDGAIAAKSAIENMGVSAKELPYGSDPTVEKVPGENPEDPISLLFGIPASPEPISSYNDLSDKPSVNGVELNGNMSLEDLNIKQTYNADEITYPSDLILTAPIGVHTIPPSGSKTLNTKGKTIKQVFDMLVAEEKNPTVTQPSVTITLTGAGAKEAGSNFTPSYTCTLNPGAYQFGPATNVTATSWSVSDANRNSSETASGSFPQFQVTDGINYTITATAQYEAGSVPVTNLGTPYPSGQIQGGSKTATKGSVTAFRNSFWGSITSKDGVIDSALVRGLPNKSNQSYTNGKTFTIQVPVGAIRVVFSYPATLREVTSVKDVNGLNAEIKSAFKMSLVNVAGANNYSPISYRTYVYDMAEANQKANSFTVTI